MTQRYLKFRSLINNARGFWNRELEVQTAKLTLQAEADVEQIA
ncbi:hypothetical protein [Nostoc sp. UHCC 0870]|nr:hypothetical protein [Nostoc sp. UHCC 0870]